MNRKIKHILSVAIFCLLVGLLSINVCAASKISNSKVNSLYKDFLSKSTAHISGSYYDRISLKGAYFMTFDIDGNGIKELIVKEKSSSYGTCQPVAYIFTVKNNKVIYVGNTCIKQDYSNTILISKKYKSIYSCYPVASYSPRYFYTVKNNKLSRKIFLYEQYGYGKTQYGSVPHESWCKSSGYFINKKKVSKNKYNNVYKKYMNSLKEYTLSANTETNRRKKIK